MHSPWRADLGQRLLSLLPQAATSVAEGAWVTIVYAAAQVGILDDPPALGLWAFAVAAGAGTVVRRTVPGRAGWLAVAAVVSVAALVGWFSDPGVQSAAAIGSVDRALVAGAGWLLALAAWRGTRHGDPATDDLVVSNLLAWGIPLLAVPWLIGNAAPTSQAFVELAFPATLVFVAAGLVAIGLTRLDALSQTVGVDWRRNRTWLVVLFGVVGLVVVIGLPMAVLLGASLEAVSRTVLGPLWAAVTGVGAVADRIVEVAGEVSPGATTPQLGSLSAAPPAEVPLLLMTAVLAVVVVAVALVLRRLVAGAPPTVRHPRHPAADDEKRQIVLPRIAPRLPSVQTPRLRLPRRARPRSATEAYLSVLRDLSRDETLARGIAETPAGHARRLRHLGAGSLAFDLLTADFELERYAGAALTPAEVRRAIRRARLRRPSQRHP